MRYRVVLTADAYMTATVEVDAATPAEADAKAIVFAQQGNASWEYMQLAEPDPRIEVVETRELP